MTRLFNKAGWIVAGVLALLVVASITGIVWGGPLNPPGPPTTPTGKMQINSLPFTIGASGSYIVNADLICTTCTAGQDGITISAGDVTLDLQGFRLVGVAGSGNGIIVPGTPSNIEIRNGIVMNWAAAGINLRPGPGTGASNSRIDDLRFYNDGGPGLASIILGRTTSVAHCSITGSLNQGINTQGDANVISDNTISNSAAYGIVVTSNSNTITNNSLSGNNTSIGSEAIFVPSTNNRIDSNTINANGKAHAITVVGSNNLVTRNAGTNASGTMYNVGAGNTSGPTETQATPLRNPWANIAY